jgi:hypothetical protein
MDRPDRFKLLRCAKNLVVDIKGAFCRFDKATGWPRYAVNESSSPLPDGICKIDETAERGISLRQLLVTYEYVKLHCVAEGWTSWDDKPLTPETVTLYDLCKYVIKPSTEAHKCSYVELVTGVGFESVRGCPDGHVPMARAEVYTSGVPMYEPEDISCTKCGKRLRGYQASFLSEEDDFYWVCHRCGDKHKLCDDCAPRPAPVLRAELQRPLWFVSHWYGPRRDVPRSYGAACACTDAHVRAGGASPSSTSSRASCSTPATGTTSAAQTTRGSTLHTGCARTRTTSTSTPPSMTGAGLRVALTALDRLSCDVTDDPAASSFAKAMALSIGTVSVLDKGGNVFLRIWCALAFLPLLPVAQAPGARTSRPGFDPHGAGAAMKSRRP